MFAKWAITYIAGNILEEQSRNPLKEPRGSKGISKEERKPKDLLVLVCDYHGKSLWNTGTLEPVFEFFEKHQIFLKKIPPC
jgi:hypothetical protein